ncbi:MULTISPECIES: DUF1304 domain-containing protein [Corynebacterium]|jgi:putative membrane protein|uniref:DUF1304 domain-containing protein n=1 Tax=Corynebacterium TaxID=1716 RepID=UPI0010316981|nr:DUF1304 domain-containing protein [Corynebacterium neomassiliense]MCI1256780.1 DUF1304 domain-containing protein [Corynebacterium provencense]
MLVVGSVLAVLAALLHVFIFYLESAGWTGPLAARVFGNTPEQAESTREMAFNQGFYNFFLAVETVVGVVFLIAGSTGIGAALVLAGTGSMLAAATVLLVTSPDKRSAAVKQGTFPLLAVVFTVVGLLV